MVRVSVRMAAWRPDPAEPLEDVLADGRRLLGAVAAVGGEADAEHEQDAQHHARPLGDERQRPPQPEEQGTDRWSGELVER